MSGQGLRVEQPAGLVDDQLAELDRAPKPVPFPECLAHLAELRDGEVGGSPLGSQAGFKLSGVRCAISLLAGEIDEFEQGVSGAQADGRRGAVAA